MNAGISTNASLKGKAACLAEAGIEFAIRYYSKPGSHKAITREEADELAAAGIRLAVVYQENARRISDFTIAKAQTHAANAWASAQAMDQPTGSTIYFAVDFDASQSDLNGVILDYFNELDKTLAELAGGRNPYHLGVYGSGRACRLLKANCPAVRFTWLSLSKGWAESRTYNNWDLNQTWGSGDLCGLTPVYVADGVLHDGDYEYNADDGDFGGFFPGVPIRGGAVGAGAQSSGTVDTLALEMDLGSGAGLRTGTLIARGDDGTVLLHASATSGRPGHQEVGSQWEIGEGPLPALPGYEVKSDADLPESNGHLGVRFALTPYTVTHPATGAERAGFSLHAAGPYPGTSGGIALLHGNDFSQLRRLLAATAAAGRSTVPLTVAYRGGVMDHDEAALQAARAVFTMELKRTSRMLYGTFEIIAGDGARIYSGRATSGLAGYQHSGAFWTRGKGVVPPTADERFILTRVYAANPPMGTRYQILPEEVWNDNHTSSRSAFRVHFDNNQPGSAGCIVTPSRSDYDRIIALFAALRSQGVKKLPLELIYT